MLRAGTSHLPAAARCRCTSSSSILLRSLPRNPARLSKQLHWHIKASASAGEPEQPSTRQPQPLDEQQQQLQQEQQLQQAAAVAAQGSAALNAVEDQILSATEPPYDEDDTSEILLQQRHQLADASWRRTSGFAYLALAAALTAGGLLVAVCAVPIAASGLKLGAELQLQQAAVLVGCWGAAMLRAASLAWFLAEGAALGELGSWRYQRLNLGLAAAAAAAAAAALTGGWAGVQPWLLLPLVAGTAAVAVACAGLAVGQGHKGGGYYFASALGYVDVFDIPGAIWVYLLYNVTCLAGALMMGMAVLGAVLGMAALNSSAPLLWLPWVAAGSSGTAALGLLHKLLGVGLLLTALQAWALTEYAAQARNLSPGTAVKLMVAKATEAEASRTGFLGPAPVHVPPRRFALLHAGFFAAAVVQGLWLAQAGVAGGGVGLLNGADPLWGGLFWSVMGSCVYLVMLLAKLDYADLAAVCLRAVDWAGGVVAAVAGVLYVDWIWISEVHRR